MDAASREYAERVTMYAGAALPGIVCGRIEDTNREYRQVHSAYHFPSIHTCPNPIRTFIRGQELPFEAGRLYLIEPGDATVVEEGAGGGSCEFIFAALELVAEAAKAMDAGIDGTVHWNAPSTDVPEILGAHRDFLAACRDSDPAPSRQGAGRSSSAASLRCWGPRSPGNRGRESARASRRFDAWWKSVSPSRWVWRSSVRYPAWTAIG
jgi:hypothetical protein